MQQLPIKVVLCGSPHSGKSCLREGLKQAMMSMHRAGKAPYPYFITACPDGEGAWFAETVRNNPALAQQLKDEYKSKFTLEFAQQKAIQVKNACLPLNLIDLGGKIDDKNKLIASYATHALILFRDITQITPWREFCLELNLQIIACIHSDYDGVADRIDFESSMLIGSIHRLQRGEDISERPMVQELARLLVGLSDSSNLYK
ncbi:hypothetical protein [Nostoc sp. DedVER01b]|uniref:hypothetical protein n=1 Tax=Nostoc sp. DedVER01b TaxID=3075404 RepID=UPI002AD55D93|nr:MULTISPECIES: hypothetical protein [unclassified Nostoc]MDZ7988623.1 hypothetical protein [Nostoc sp. DedVER02]MDZ8113653.1 hypothetical protein [Nostoc sp. DedVER01b]